MKTGNRKYIIITAALLCCLTAGTKGQEPEGESRSITIVYPDSTVKAAMLASRPELKIRSDRMYYWVYDERIFNNRGDYAYYLLDGEYRVFDTQNKLITKGRFLMGVKDGQWKNWHLNGELRSTGRYVKGQKKGYWYYYDSTGAVLSRLRYKNDLLNGKCIRYRDGDRTVMYYRKGRECKEMFHWISDHVNGKMDDDAPADRLDK